MMEIHIPPAGCAQPDGPFVDTEGLLPLIASCMLPEDKRDAQDLILIGPHGTGKSLMSLHLAQQIEGMALDRGLLMEGYRMPVVRTYCHSGMRDYHMIGSMALADGDSVFNLGPLPAAIHWANEYRIAVLLVEECGELPPKAQKLFNPIADWQGVIDVPQIGKEYRLDPGARLLIMFNGNPAAGYSGHELNTDLMSRSLYLRLPWPSKADLKSIVKARMPEIAKLPGTDGGKNGEQTINAIVDLSLETRAEAFDYTLSTRDVLDFLKTWKQAGTAFALRSRVYDRFPQEQHAAIIDKATDFFEGQIKLPASRRLRPTLSI